MRETRGQARRFKRKFTKFSKDNYDRLPNGYANDTALTVNNSSNSANSCGDSESDISEYTDSRRLRTSENSDDENEEPQSDYSNIDNVENENSALVTSKDDELFESSMTSFDTSTHSRSSGRKRTQTRPYSPTPDSVSKPLIPSEKSLHFFGSIRVKFLVLRNPNNCDVEFEAGYDRSYITIKPDFGILKAGSSVKVTITKSFGNESESDSIQFSSNNPNSSCGKRAKVEFVYVDLKFDRVQ